MTTKPRLLFDECVGKPLVEKLQALLLMAVDDNDAELAHILDIYQQQGTLDTQWIPQIATGGWIVITGDLGRGGGAKLPKLCSQYGVTHVLLSPSMGTRKSLEKLLSVLSVWYELLAMTAEPPGSRFQLEPNGAGKGKLVRKVVRELGQPPPPRGELFAK